MIYPDRVFLPVGENTDPPEPDIDPRELRLMQERQLLLDRIADIEFILCNEYGKMF